MQTFTPTEYLKIDIASNFGLEKEDWDVRLEWFEENQSNLENLVEEADEPALFYAGMRAYRQTQSGQNIGYPISLDATASGAQLLAVLIGCEKSARLCNVVNTGRREDFYTNQYKHMMDRINDRGKIGRPMIKDAIMPALYGSEAKPKEVFGEGDLLAAFYDTMETESPGIWELNKALVGLWQDDAYSHDWVLPDNYHVKIKTMVDRFETVHFQNKPYEVHTRVNEPAEEGRSVGANTIHSIDGMVVREMERRCNYDRARISKVIEAITSPVMGVPLDRKEDKMVQILWDHYQETNFLSARILDYLDLENIGLVDQDVIQELIETLPAKPFPVLAVHDCFRVHPNYGNDLRKQYNQILHELAKSDILSSIASQLLGHKVSVTKYGDIADQILKADYALS